MGVDVSFQLYRSEHKVSDSFRKEITEMVKNHIYDCGLESKPQLHINIGFCFVGDKISIESYSCNFLLDPNQGAEQFCDPT